MIRQVTELTDVLDIQSPDLTGIKSETTFVEWILKDNNLYFHVFKPVEADIRTKESEAKQLCKAPWPLSDDPLARLGQRKAQAILKQCNVRRNAWKEIRWPDLSQPLEDAVKKENLQVLEYDLEFVPAMDGWSVIFHNGGRIGKKKRDQVCQTFSAELDNFFKKHRWTWPKEIFESSLRK